MIAIKVMRISIHLIEAFILTIILIGSINSETPEGNDTINTDTQNDTEITEIIEAKDVVPLLFNITHIQEITHNYESLRVYLKETPHKGGVGVFARRRILENRTVMYYKIKVYHNSNYTSLSKGIYSFSITKKDDSGHWDNLIGDIYEDSNQKPKGKIPFWGYLANEPDESQTPNTHADSNAAENYLNKDTIQLGDVVVYKLVSTRNIEPDEEITWCYGAGYVRGYKANCN